MSIELTTRETGKVKSFYDGYCEQEISCDINLPDYCPDIMRILKCTVKPNITGSKITGDRATAEGTAKINVIYSDEKNNIFCYNTDYPFSKYVELSAPCDSASLVTKSKVEFVNCRAVSKRRIDIHGALSIFFKVVGTSRDTVISSATGDGIQLKRKSIDTSSVTAVTDKKFQLSSVEKLSDTMPGIGKIIDCTAAPIISETRIIKGKLLIKGELAVRVIYCSDSEENATAVLTCEIPFNEIAEATDFNDNCRVNIEMQVLSLTAEPKVDNDGEYRYMNISADLCAGVTAYEDICANVVNDAYSTQSEIDTKYTLLDFPKISTSFSDTISCKESLDLSALNPQKIYTVLVSQPDVKCRFDEGKMNISGKISLSIVIINNEGVPVCCEREAAFEYSRSAEGDKNRLTCIPQIDISEFACNLNGNGCADFKAELSLCATIFENCKEKVLTSLAVCENTQKEKKSSLTIYFCSGNESLWEIARHYNTTVEDIMEENELTADCIEGKKMLMIPVK